MSSTIEQLLEAIAGGGIEMEVIKLKDGQSIEDIIKLKGLKPIGEDCAGCGLHHEYEGPDGEKVYLTPAGDDEKEPEDGSEFNKRRASALTGIRKRQAKVLRMYDILKDMERTIALDADDRDSENLFKEITQYIELQALARSL